MAAFARFEIPPLDVAAEAACRSNTATSEQADAVMRRAIVLEMTPADFCFLCHKSLGDVDLVYWNGCGEAGGSLTVWLHAECAIGLGVRLIADGRSLVSPPNVEATPCGKAWTKADYLARLRLRKDGRR